jgi:hypothetical protein
MKTRLFLTIYFFAWFSCCYGMTNIDEPSSEYQIIDIGLPLGDNGFSGLYMPFAINEQGQAIGYFKTSHFDSDSYLFLWTLKSGLQLLDLHFVNPEKVKFNDLGQIIGEEHYDRMLMWDPEKGVINLPITLDSHMDLISMNNSGQVLFSALEERGNLYINALMFFDGLKFIDLNKKFKEQFPKEWTIISWTAPCAFLNNNGEILISCSRISETGQIEKALFLFQNNQFKMIPISYVDYICDFDDDGVALVYSTKYPTAYYLINLRTEEVNRIELINSSLAQSHLKLKNGVLSDIYHADLALVDQKDGVRYYRVGPRVQDLITTKKPYISKDINIIDKNNKGWIIGTIPLAHDDPFFTTYHKGTSVFVGIPKEDVLPQLK